MSRNPFADWNQEDVARHNQQVATKSNRNFRSPARLEPVLPKPFKPVIVQSTDEANLNKLERAWLLTMRARRLENIGIQNITLKLADRCRYTPDFSAIVNGEFTFFETKGFFRDDAKVKIKSAARIFRWAKFVLVEKKKGQWVETSINP